MTPVKRAPAFLFTALSVVSDEDLILTNLSKEEISWLCSWNVIGPAYRIKGRTAGTRAPLGAGFGPSETHFLSQLSLLCLTSF